MDESESRWRVYRATFDTNIFLRALIQRGNLADNLLSQWSSEENNMMNHKQKLGYTCLGAAIMCIGLTKNATRRSL